MVADIGLRRGRPPDRLVHRRDRRPPRPPALALLHPFWSHRRRLIGWITTRPSRSRSPTSTTARSPRARTGTRRTTSRCRVPGRMGRERQAHAWDLFRAATQPLGHDPYKIWPDGPDEPRRGRPAAHAVAAARCRDGDAAGAVALGRWCGGLAVQRDAGDDQRHAVTSTADGTCAEHDDPDHGRGRGQQRDHQRVGRARQARHRELVADVRDDRRARCRRRRRPAAPTGSSSAGTAAQPPSGVTTTSAISIEAAEAVDARRGAALARRGGRARCRARTAPRWRTRTRRRAARRRAARR